MSLSIASNPSTQSIPSIVSQAVQHHHSPLISHIEALTNLLKVNIDYSNRKLRPHFNSINKNINSNISLNNLYPSFKSLFLPPIYELYNNNNELHLVTKLVPKPLPIKPKYSIKLLTSITPVIKHKNESKHKTVTSSHSDEDIPASPSSISDIKFLRAENNPTLIPVSKENYNLIEAVLKPEEKKTLTNILAEANELMIKDNLDYKTVSQYMLPNLTLVIDDHKKKPLKFNSETVKQYFKPFERKVIPYLQKRYNSIETDKDGNKLVSLVTKISIINGWSHLPEKLNDILIDYFKFRINGVEPTGSSNLYDNG